MDITSLHLFSLALTALVILYSDHEGFAYFTGKKQVLSHTFVTWSHRFVWIGLLSMIATGVLMIVPAWEYYLSDSVFMIKMSFVAVLIVNAFAIGKLGEVATQKPFATLTTDEKRTLIISGFLSGVSWVGAAGVAFLFL
jgi:hypothetical protein